ncbi:sensor histidine kinase [Thiomicrorhabdus sp.]|uniref:sensor histidine kinase n=1 Tax=Thiomicrorhabdus sp. TaxID=2039724 RepID=UPI0029C9ACB5|nr:sensor histidine kinase [Thiomicrorhabdus sp.]
MTNPFKKEASLQQQLFASILVSLLVIFSLFWWLSESAIHKLTESYLLTRLEHDTDSIQRNIEPVQNGWRVDPKGIEPIYLTPYSGHYYVIQTTDGREIKSDSLEDFPLYLKPFDSEVGVYETRGPVENTILVRSQTLTVDGEKMKIFVAENHEPIQKVLFQFDALFGILTILALLSLYGLHKWLLKRSFSRLEPLENKLREFQLGHRIKIDSSLYPQEVASLIDGLNLALQQSQLQFEKSRQHNANLSHSLKTPLNMIFQLLDSGYLDNQKNIADLRQQSNIILSLIERELKADRIARHQALSPLVLLPLVEELQSTFSQLYRSKDLRFRIEVEDQAQLQMEKEDAYELLGNLLDNACKWSTDLVSLSFRDGVLCIEDNGPGVSDETLNLLEKRGFRGDETKPGHGIGLSMVKELVSAYHARLLFEHSKFGGLKVCIDFSKKN